jgi:hypothetical protein
MLRHGKVHSADFFSCCFYNNIHYCFLKFKKGKKEARSYRLPIKDCCNVPNDYGIKQSGSNTSKDTIYSGPFWLSPSALLQTAFFFPFPFKDYFT